MQKDLPFLFIFYFFFNLLFYFILNMVVFFWERSCGNQTLYIKNSRKGTMWKSK